MLVQLGLEQIRIHDPYWRTTISPDGTSIDADGKCGPITKNAIWRFQTRLRRGVLIYPDGTIDPVSASGKTGTDFEYTLLWLNLILQSAIGKTRFADLAEQLFTPPALKSRIRGT